MYLGVATANSVLKRKKDEISQTNIIVGQYFRIILALELILITTKTF